MKSVKNEIWDLAFIHTRYTQVVRYMTLDVWNKIIVQVANPVFILLQYQVVNPINNKIRSL